MLSLDKLPLRAATVDGTSAGFPLSGIHVQSSCSSSSSSSSSTVTVAAFFDDAPLAALALHQQEQQESCDGSDASFGSHELTWRERSRRHGRGLRRALSDSAGQQHDTTSGYAYKQAVEDTHSTAEESARSRRARELREWAGLSREEWTGFQWYHSEHLLSMSATASQHSMENAVRAWYGESLETRAKYVHMAVSMPIPLSTELAGGKDRCSAAASCRV